jgi:hypothetical protein
LPKYKLSLVTFGMDCRIRHDARTVPPDGIRYPVTYGPGPLVRIDYESPTAAGTYSMTATRIGVKTIFVTRKRSLRLLGIVLLVMMSGVEGCAHCHYGAHATLVAPTANAAPELLPPSEVLGDALRPLGFNPGHNVKLDYFYYEIGVGFPPGASRISVSWQPESGLIAIYDFRSFEASDLDRKVQEAIEIEIERAYGQKLKFIPYSNKSSQCVFGP